MDQHLLLLCLPGQCHPLEREFFISFWPANSVWRNRYHQNPKLCCSTLICHKLSIHFISAQGEKILKMQGSPMAWEHHFPLSSDKGFLKASAVLVRHGHWNRHRMFIINTLKSKNSRDMAEKFLSDIKSRIAFSHSQRKLHKLKHWHIKCTVQVLFRDTIFKGPIKALAQFSYVQKVAYPIFPLQL